MAISGASDRSTEAMVPWENLQLEGYTHVIVTNRVNVGRGLDRPIFRTFVHHLVFYHNSIKNKNVGNRVEQCTHAAQLSK